MDHLNSGGRRRYNSAPPDLPAGKGPRRDQPLPPLPLPPLPTFPATASDPASRSTILRPFHSLIPYSIWVWGTLRRWTETLRGHIGVATRYAVLAVRHWGIIAMMVTLLLALAVRTKLTPYYNEFRHRVNLYNDASHPAFFDDFDTRCPPVFLYYPDFPRAIGLPHPLLPSLTALMWSSKNVKTADKHQLLCFGPGKARRHWGDYIDEDYARKVRVLQRNVTEVLSFGHGYPRHVIWDGPNGEDMEGSVEDSPAWNRSMSRVEAGLPRYGPGSEACTLELALKHAATQIWSNEYTPAPVTIEEAEGRQWFPCDLRTAWAPFAYVADFEWGWWGLLHIHWKKENLPPRHVHEIWYDDDVWKVPPPPAWRNSSSIPDYIFEQASYQLFKYFLRRLRFWGWSLWVWNFSTRVNAFSRLPFDHKLDLLREGWIDKWSVGFEDPAVQEFERREEDRIKSYNIKRKWIEA